MQVSRDGVRPEALLHQGLGDRKMEASSAMSDIEFSRHVASYLKVFGGVTVFVQQWSGPAVKVRTDVTGP